MFSLVVCAFGVIFKDPCNSFSLDFIKVMIHNRGFIFTKDCLRSTGVDSLEILLKLNMGPEWTLLGASLLFTENLTYLALRLPLVYVDKCRCSDERSSSFIAVFVSHLSENNYLTYFREIRTCILPLPPSSLSHFLDILLLYYWAKSLLLAVIKILLNVPLYHDHK